MSGAAHAHAVRLRGLSREVERCAQLEPDVCLRCVECERFSEGGDRLLLHALLATLQTLRSSRGRLRGRLRRPLRQRPLLHLLLLAHLLNLQVKLQRAARQPRGARRARGALVRLTRTCLLGLGLARSLGAGLARRPSLQLSLRLGWRHSLRLGVGPEEHDE